MMPSSAIDARPDTRSSLSAGSDQARITTSDSPALPPPIPSRHAQIARSHRRIQPRLAASRSRQPLQSSHWISIATSAKRIRSSATLRNCRARIPSETMVKPSGLQATLYVFRSSLLSQSPTTSLSDALSGVAAATGVGSMAGDAPDVGNWAGDVGGRSGGRTIREDKNTSATCATNFDASSSPLRRRVSRARAPCWQSRPSDRVESVRPSFLAGRISSLSRLRRASDPSLS